MALQGAFHAHVLAIEQCGSRPRLIKGRRDLDLVDALILPGGESTTMSNLLMRSGCFDAIAERIAAGMATLGTCAGAILLSREISDGRPDQAQFAAIGVCSHRNAYGRQIASFECDLMVKGWDSPYHAVFIRAPRFSVLDESVEVLASLDGSPVMVRDGSTLVTSFHPELTSDLRVHRYFLDEVVGA